MPPKPGLLDGGRLIGGGCGCDGGSSERMSCERISRERMSCGGRCICSPVGNRSTPVGKLRPGGGGALRSGTSAGGRGGPSSKMVPNCAKAGAATSVAAIAKVLRKILAIRPAFSVTTGEDCAPALGRRPVNTVIAAWKGRLRLTLIRADQRLPSGDHAL